MTCPTRISASISDGSFCFSNVPYIDLIYNLNTIHFTFDLVPTSTTGNHQTLLRRICNQRQSHWSSTRSCLIRVRCSPQNNCRRVQQAYWEVWVFLNCLHHPLTLQTPLLSSLHQQRAQGLRSRALLQLDRH